MTKISVVASLCRKAQRRERALYRCRLTDRSGACVIIRFCPHFCVFFSGGKVRREAHEKETIPPPRHIMIPLSLSTSCPLAIRTERALSLLQYLPPMCVSPHIYLSFCQFPLVIWFNNNFTQMGKKYIHAYKRKNATSAFVANDTDCFNEMLHLTR